MRYCFYILLFFSFSSKSQVCDSTKLATPELHGYLKYMEQVSFLDSPDTNSVTTLIHNRLNFRWSPVKHWLLRVENRNRIFYGDQLKSNRAFMKTLGEDKGAFDLSKIWIDEYSLGFHSTIDRALINYSNEQLDITVGRQRINWGLNMVWNPNDIFNTYNFFDFDYEERPGSDAVRIQYQWKGFSAIELAVKKGKSDDDITAAVMYRGNKKGYDHQFISGIYRKDIVLGLGWAGSIKDAGFKGEFSYFHSYQNFEDSVGVLNGSISLDYSFKNGLYIHFSSYYNSAGREHVNFLSTQEFFVVNPKQLLPFRFSGFFQLSKQIDPLFTLGMSNIYSPTNNTWIVVPNIQYNIASNWEVTLLGQSFFANVNSVYRTLGNSLFLRFKWSF